MTASGLQTFYGITRYLEQQTGAENSVGIAAPSLVLESYLLIWPDSPPADPNSVLVATIIQDNEVTLDWHYAGTSQPRICRKSFTDADLELGILPVFHGLTVESVCVNVWNEKGKLVQPDDVYMQDVNTIKIDLSSFRAVSIEGKLQGTWRVIITG